MIAYPIPGSNTSAPAISYHRSAPSSTYFAEELASPKPAVRLTKGRVPVPHPRPPRHHRMRGVLRSRGAERRPSLEGVLESNDEECVSRRAADSRAAPRRSSSTGQTCAVAAKRKSHSAKSTAELLSLGTTRRSAPSFAGRQALHRHEAYRYVGGGEWTQLRNAREASARHGACAAPTRRGLPTSAIR